MKSFSNECVWEKQEQTGDEKPLARAQHVAVSYPKNDKVFIFGGHNSPKTRLNDTWVLTVKDFEWARVGGDKDNLTNQDSSIGAPAPRANTSATLYDNKIYLFGGHGGINYARTSFNDLYCFDLETETWELIVPASSHKPEPRGGHSVFASDQKVYIYGGWNNEMQFNKVEVFDLEKKEWTDPDVDNGVHRWNHSAVLVEAIPTWKFFIFGGECAEYNEGSARSFGQNVNSSCFLDLGTIQWTTYASDPAMFEEMPAPREYAAMAYEKRESKLLIYGGWNNGWFSDLFSLNVGKIVGPSYAITASEPNLGQLSGNVNLKITG